MKVCMAFAPEAEIEECVGSTSEPTVWLVGDSHARQLKETFARATSRQVKVITWDGSKYPLGNIERLLGRLMKSSDLFVYARRYCCVDTKPGSELADEAKLAVDISQVAGVPLLTLGDNAQFPKTAPLCHLDAEQTGASESPCATDKTEVVKLQSPFHSLYEGLTKTSHVYFFDYLDLLCPGNKCDIYVPGTKTLANQDAHHVSEEGAHFLAPWFCSFLKSKGLNNFADLHKPEA
eukprot:TRINITY_DN7058_c0_g1_i1.p1 TRINITY_DN7058_c0_g1~~TRINITY_DN7058_c0_g1_i1.p1  ORF type:complete len:235 (-),score=31.45 TRINITY_DN7058_c0_g1_i1:26-730(-)